MMRFLKLVLLAAVSSPLVAVLAHGSEPVVLGEYIETRTCNLWTRPYHESGGTTLGGDHAVLAWCVRSGSWDGVELKDLTIAAVLDSEGTLSTSTEGKVRTVVHIDENASEEQGKALVSMAATLAPMCMKEIVRIEKRKITFQREGEQVKLVLGGVAEVTIQTMPPDGHCDSICGNNSRPEPTLSAVTHVEFAETFETTYSGSDLGLRWSDPGRRSVLFASFSL